MRARLLDVYARVLEAASGLVETSNEEELFDRMCAAAVEHGGLALAWVGTWNRDTGLVEIVAARGRTDYLDGLQITVDPRDARSRGPAGRAVRERRVVTFNDIRSAEAMRPWRERAIAHGLEAAAAIPLLADGGAYAALTIYATQPHFFTQEEILLAEQLAASGALIRRVKETEADRFRLALAGSTLTAFTMDRELRYTWAENPALGFTSEMMVGRCDADLLPREAAERITAIKRRVIEQGKPVAVAVPVADEWYWLSAQPVRGADGAVAGLAGQFIDITARKRAELELERLASAAEHGMDSIVSLDRDGRIRRWNRGAERLFGWCADEALGRTVGELGVEGGHPLVLAGIARVMEGGRPFTYDVARRRKDGSRVDVIATIVPWEVDGEVVGVTVIAVDVSERRRAERERERALVDMQDAQQLAAIGSWTWDPSSGARTWSPQLFALHGRDPALGVPPSGGAEDVHEDDRERYVQAFDRMLAGGPLVDEEVRLVTRAGDERVIHAVARPDPRRPGCYMGTIQDVTEQRRAERERAQTLAQLHEVDALFSNGFDASPIGMALVGEDGILQRVNASAAAMLGYAAPAQLVGRAWRDFVHPDDHGRTRAAVSDVHETGERTLVQLRCQARNGGDVHALLATTLVRSAPDRPPTYFSQLLDITDRVRVERALADSEARYRRILDTTLEGVWTLDADDVITFVNPALAEMLDATAEQMIGTSIFDWVDETMGDARAQLSLHRHGAGGQREVTLSSARGRKVWALIAANPMLEPDGRYAGALAMVADISDRKRMEVRLKHLADHDPLTGVFNRRRLVEELDEHLRAAARSGRGGAALVLDVDHLKFVNDTYGHGAGDTLLRTVADVLRSRLRRTDVLARLGGDEFALVLPQVTQDEAMGIAHDILARLAERDAVPPIEASIGVVPFTGAEQLTADEILVCADTALYEAKEHGGDQARIYTGQASGALHWVQRIRAALAGNRFVLHGQPILDLRTNRVAKHELLVRMLSDDGEPIPPAAFLPTAERFGLIHELDLWVTGHGLDLARAGHAVTINLSGYSVDHKPIVALASRAVEQGLDASCVTFEITETAAMTNLAAAKQFVQTLAELGYSVALDDFGTGFGSFVYLKHIPARYLKIDMEFVRGLVESVVDQEVVRSIVGIARSLGKLTIAEGVEDDATRELLRAFGVDYVQGYAIGRPAPLSPGPAS